MRKVCKETIWLWYTASTQCIFVNVCEEPISLSGNWKIIAIIWIYLCCPKPDNCWFFISVCFLPPPPPHPSLHLGILNTQPQYFQDWKREKAGLFRDVHLEIHSLRSLLLLSGLSLTNQGENPFSHYVLKLCFENIKLGIALLAYSENPLVQDSPPSPLPLEMV